MSPTLRGRLEYHLSELTACMSAPATDPLFAMTSPVQGKVLEIGCGLGQVLASLSTRGSPQLTVGLDSDWPLLSQHHLVRDRVPRSDVVSYFVAGDALTLPFKAGTFDLVVCRLVLMSLPVRAALQEIVRVLGPSGRLYLHLTGPGFYVQDFLRGRRLSSLFGLVNGTLLSMTSRQLRIKGLWNNYQSLRSVRQSLRRDGLKLGAVEYGAKFWLLHTNVKVLAHRGSS